MEPVLATGLTAPVGVMRGLIADRVLDTPGLMDGCGDAAPGDIAIPIGVDTPGTTPGFLGLGLYGRFLLRGL